MLNTPFRRPSAKPQGFTVVEMVVVLLILGFLMAVAVPNMADWLRNLKVRGVAESLRTGLDKARMEALKSNRPVSYWLVKDDSSKVPGASCELSSSGLHWVVSEASPAGKCKDSSVVLHRSEALDDQGQVTVAAVDLSGDAANTVTFTGLGQVAAAGMLRQITVSRADGKGRPLRVLVETGGSVRTCDPGVSSSDPRACP